MAKASPKTTAAHHTPGLHYDEAALHADYRQVFGWLMKTLFIGVFGALVYFFVFMVYLGGWSHTPSTDYAKEFNERYPIDYKGLKIPEFGGPTTPPAPHHGTAEATTTESAH